MVDPWFCDEKVGVIFGSRRPRLKKYYPTLDKILIYKKLTRNLIAVYAHFENLVPGAWLLESSM